MAAVESTMLALGTEAPAFALPNSNPEFGGETVDLQEARGANGLLVMFICNHCPFVKNIADELARLGTDCAHKGIGVVAVSSNDAANYPDDSPAKMAEEAGARGYRFPYVYDESQEVAKAYRAACTPDFYLFDANLKLAYRGRLDSSTPGNGEPVTGKDLRNAVDALLGGGPVPEPHVPSMGCNIKWVAGNEPDYFG